MTKIPPKTMVAIAALFTGGCAATASPDGSAEPDGTSLDTTQLSRCQVSATEVTCDHSVRSVSDSLVNRDVAYQVPLGTPPANGWPAVLYYQGSFVPGASAFSGSVFAPFGVFDLARTIKALLDDGYAVIAPNAADDGTTFWETNIPPFSTRWGSPAAAS